MEHLTPSPIAAEMPPTSPAPKRVITIPLDRQSALAGLAVVLLLALAIETYQLVTLRGALARGPIAPVAAAGTSAAPSATPNALDTLPNMSGGC